MQSEKTKRISTLLFNIIIIPTILTLTAILAPKAALAYEFDLNGYELGAEAYYLVNTDTGRVTAELNGEEKRAPASLTKMMTALVVLENCDDLQEKVTVKGELIQGLKEEDLSTAELIEGEIMSIEDLLYCLLMVSAADAANVLADHIGGSIVAFVGMMNEKAAELGLTNTHYADTYGLRDAAAGQYSTAKDQATLCAAALENETFARIVSTAKHTVPATNKAEARQLRSTNLLLHKDSPYGYPQATGVKTGYTEAAGRCLASAATNGKENYICVVMGCESDQPLGAFVTRQFTDSIYLYEQTFADYALKTVCDSEEALAIIHDRCFGINEDVPLAPAEDFRWLLKNDEALVTEVTTEQKNLASPVKKGEKLGECRIILDGTELRTIDLVAGKTVNRSLLLMAVNTLTTLIIASPVIIAVILILRAVLRRKGKRKSGPANKPEENPEVCRTKTQEEGQYQPLPKGSLKHLPANRQMSRISYASKAITRSTNDKRKSDNRRRNRIPPERSADTTR